jgi:DNA (cytosine-5)-methyltransferase 3A
MNVISCFDGMSCGQLALKKSCIAYDNYFAYEIKKIAIDVTRSNFPETKFLGDIRFSSMNLHSAKKIGLILAGSPCQDFSVANKTGCKGLDGHKSSLFYNFYDIKNRLGAVPFVLENVKVRGKDLEIINNLLGVEGFEINSNLFTFQNRNRMYWTNIPFDKNIQDKNISFQDFKGISIRRPLNDYAVKKTPSRIKMFDSACPNVTYRKKINCLTRKQDRWGNAGLVSHNDFCRYLTNEECELAQGVPVGYTKCVSMAQSWDLLGDGWTVDVVSHILNGLK